MSNSLFCCNAAQFALGMCWVWSPANGTKLMRRREFISLIGSAAIAWPLAARAQQDGRVRRVGLLMGYSEGDPEGQANLAAFAIGGKWLEILKEIAPHVTRVAVILHPETPPNVDFWRAAEAAGPSFGVKVIALGVHNVAEIEGRVTEFAAEPNGGLVIAPHAVTLVHRNVIIGLAARYRLPAVYGFRIFATSGGLISYGTSPIEQFRRGASYVDRILKGEKPGDLPVQNPTKYELVINLKTAKALGADVPLNLQQLADEVIE